MSFLSFNLMGVIYAILLFLKSKSLRRNYNVIVIILLLNCKSGFASNQNQFIFNCEVGKLSSQNPKLKYICNRKSDTQTTNSYIFGSANKMDFIQDNYMKIPELQFNKNFIIENDTNIILENYLSSQENLKNHKSSSSVYFGSDRLKKAYHNANQNIDIHKRKLWIQKVVSHFLPEADTSEFPILEFSELEHEDFYLLRTRVIKKGKVIFSDGSQLILITHSDHEDPGIGDITIAMDDKKNFFVNAGHICGDIINFVTNQKLKYLNASNFLSKFYSDVDEEKWNPVKFYK